uniref:hypothetical protein n=1 Tax=Paraburkholderia sp. J63 TaxID=2805434 RepID=UPI002ABD91FA
IKEPQGVELPWKDSYGYTMVPLAQVLFVCLLTLGLGLLDTTPGWNGLDTACLVVAIVGSAGFFAVRYFRHKQLLHECWRVLHGGSS